MLHPGTSCWGLREHRKPARPAGGTGSSWLVSAAQVCAGCVAQSSAKPTPRPGACPGRGAAFRGSVPEVVSPADRTAGKALCCGSASLAFLHLLWGLREPQEESAALPPKLCIALGGNGGPGWHVLQLAIS